MERMFVVTAIPIARAITAEELTYFSSQHISPGTVVSAPLRRRHIRVLVVSCQSVREQKATLRDLDYSLKKVDSRGGSPLFSHAFMRAVETLAQRHAVTRGAVLSLLTPALVLQKLSSITLPALKPQKKQKPLTRSLQAPYKERLTWYQKHIAEALRDNSSVLVLTPTIARAEHLAGDIQDSYLFHSARAAGAFTSDWEKATGSTEPVVVVGTAAALALPREDIGLIIIEEEGNRTYTFQERPYLDVREVARDLAHEHGALLCSADSILRLETFSDIEKGEVLLEKKSHTHYPRTKLAASVIDMRQYKPERSGDIAIISDELAERITQTDNEHTFIFAARRGLAPITVCSDCGKTVTCKRCSAPAVLHEREHLRLFQCRHCGEERSANERCGHCGSWNLIALGVGILRIEQALSDLFHDRTILRLDRESAPTQRRAEAIIKEWQETPGALLVGTERALSFLPETVSHIALGAFDSLFALPDFRIEERIFRLLMGLRERTKKSFTIQTRFPENRAVTSTLEGDVEGFLKQELTERTALGYPPATQLIQIRFAGTKEKEEAAREYLNKHFAKENIAVYTPLIPVVRGKHVASGIITLPANTDIPESLTKKLRALPPNFAVDVNPESIL